MKLEPLNNNIILEPEQKESDIETVLMASVVVSTGSFNKDEKVLIPEYAGQIYKDLIIVDESEIICKILNK